MKIMLGCIFCWDCWLGDEPIEPREKPGICDIGYNGGDIRDRSEGGGTDRTSVGTRRDGESSGCEGKEP